MNITWSRSDPILSLCDYAKFKQAIMENTGPPQYHFWFDKAKLTNTFGMNKCELLSMSKYMQKTNFRDI